jgi:SAM-dependent methyltransferase
MIKMLEIETTGERIYPKSFHEAYKDHRNRYYWALNYVLKDSYVLDLACGVGYGTKFIAENSSCMKVTGVDVSSNALKWAEEYFNSSKVEYFCKDIEAQLDELNCEDYDLITCFETVEHVKDDLTFIKKLYELLAPNGTLLISAPNESVIPFNNNPFFKNGINPFHYRHYTSENFQNLLNEGGFFIKEFYSQHEEIMVGQDLATNILVCKKNPPHKVLSINDYDYIIQLCTSFKANYEINDSLPDYNIIGHRFSNIVHDYLKLIKVQKLIEDKEFSQAFNELSLINTETCPEKLFLEGLAYECLDQNYNALECFFDLLKRKEKVSPVFEKLSKEHMKRIIGTEFLGTSI